MPVFRLDERLVFPEPELAEESGLLAVGGDLRADRLLLAYSLGIFPWYHEGLPILWHSPDPRMVLVPSAIHVPRSLEKRMRRRPYRITADTSFSRVIRACAAVERPDQDSTWITPEMETAYLELHERGYAHSVEAWRGDELCGGLYGISLGAAFFGESMFATATDASKIAFVTLVRALEDWDFHMVDCQVYTTHLARFGAEPWPRAEFLAALRKALDRPTHRGRWEFGADEDQP
jgi:leucyl/phenylalanyl-tRNA---protein transferase